MIVDSRKITLRAPLECDVCIVGAGAAGIAVALELSRSRISVCMLEAGGLGLGDSPQSMLEGETGFSSYPPLHAVRVAGLGGSMRVWAGWCRPLDDVDFERRQAIPHSGWPFGPAELSPYYARAHEMLELGLFDYDPAVWERACGAARLRPGGGDIANILFRRSAVNLGVSCRGTLERSERVTLRLHANAIRLRFSPDGRAVTAIETATLNGRSFEVRPRMTVLAAGGIESPRLLLLSSQAERGPGNRNGLVGRYFTEHGYDDGGSYIPCDPDRALGFYYPGIVAGASGASELRGAFAPTAEALRRTGSLNCAIHFRPAYESDPVFDDARVRAALELWDMYRSRAVPHARLARAFHALGAPHALLRALWRRFTERTGRSARVPLLALYECAPDPGNRVTLGEGRDALGRRVARLEWRMGEHDRQGVTRAWRLLDSGLRSAGLGRVEMRSAAVGGPRGLAGTLGQHHLGTMRMHRDPDRGVVDENARVHGVDNLFVAGGSVFTTGGYANPTLTIVALALRLAVHLRRQLERWP